MIDVIIPVYGGFEQTRRCIESVLAHAQRAEFRPVVVDDASPEPRIAEYLDTLARPGRIELVRNADNMGFVRSVNRAMALHPDRDVVLLNSDTEVANDWLDRLHASAYSGGQVGTATPFSNNATICSYPYEGWQGGLPGTLGLAALDGIFARTNAGRTVDIPTAVGFCMYIRRDCLAAVGTFDAERFGRGYGEENDFCMRAGKAGWRHVLAGDVFVFHEGGVSFSEERFALMKAAGVALVEVHPEYNRAVHEFIIADPPRAFRDGVDLARVQSSPEEAAAVVKERSDERARILGGLLELDKLAAERNSTIGQLRYALEHAGTQMAERDRAIADITDFVRERERQLAEHAQEIERLRAGLGHAESLAFERQAELERLKSFLPVRAYNAMLRRFTRGSPS